MKFLFSFALVFVFCQMLRAEPITLVTPTGSLHGTLELPEKIAAPYPVALIIAGSGPTDRDGNSAILPGRNDSLKMLAEALAARGIASVRYDKRGIGQSTPAGAREADLRFGTLIDDARVWGKHMKRDKRFSSLTIVGHSEGSLIGLVAARKCDADAFVSIAGVDRPAGVLLRDQLRAQLPPDLMQQAERIIAQLERGKSVSSIPPQLEVLFRSSVQPYLISWFRYHPAREIQKFFGPVLIVQGSSDIQVSEAEARRLAQAKPDAKLLLIEGMNHVLKSVPDDREKQLASYSEPSLPIVPSLIEAVAQFIIAAR